jgi:hypothetical protein
MKEERHELTLVPLLLWIVATILLVFFCVRLLLLAMGYPFGIVGWVEVAALGLAGLMLLALGSILDRLTRIVFYLHEHKTITKYHTRLLATIANAASVEPDEPQLSSK